MPAAIKKWFELQYSVFYGEFKNKNKRKKKVFTFQGKDLNPKSKQF